MLTRRDFEALLECTQVMAAVERTEELDGRLMTALARLVRADVARHEAMERCAPQRAGFETPEEGWLSTVLAVGARNLAVVTLHERCVHVFALGRDRHDFEPANRERLALVQLHVRAVCERLERTLARPPRNRWAQRLSVEVDTTTAVPVHPSGGNTTPPLDRLSARELQVLAELADGRSNRQIARRLQVSHRTVEKHVEHILRKLDVRSRTAAAAQYLKGPVSRPVRLPGEHPQLETAPCQLFPQALSGAP